MMVRDGAILMRGGGRKKGGRRTEGGGVIAGQVETNWGALENSVGGSGWGW